MIHEIMRSEMFLAMPSEEAGPEDLQVGRDLLDTLAANAEGCVGMAANMIGVRKRVIVYTAPDGDHVMFNPRIVKRGGAYRTEEGCLSLVGVRPCERFRTIVIDYQEPDASGALVRKTGTFKGYVAQIIQHECDHLEGVVI